MSNYDINSIQSLSFRDGVRTRINMYLGTDDVEGTYQAFKEILNNSTDEALAGFGSRIEICVNESENSMSVRDYGRGVPFGFRDDGTNVLVSVYTDSHTGGKFDKSAYKNSSGLNGIGGSCVCLSSEKFLVKSVRGDKTATAKFTKGILDEYVEKEVEATEKNGTYVYFIPDKEVFSNGDIGFSYERLCQDIKDISYLYSGIEFVVRKTDVGAEEENVFCAKNGIKDFVKDSVTKPINRHIIYETITDDDTGDSLEIAFQWGVKKEQAYVFVNGLRCPEGGTPIAGAKAAILRTLNSLSKAEFDGDKVRENLFYVVNCKVSSPSFANQTKSKINNQNLRTMSSKAFSSGIKKMSVQYPDEFALLIEMFRKIMRAEAAAEKAREAILNYEKDMTAAAKKKIIDSNKLRDARILGEESMLIINEGLSAGGSMSVGRQGTKNGDKVGILMLRGKVINALSNPIEDVLSNEEVKLLFQALGLVYGQPYNSSKLRYGKIAIAVDADFDGSHIGLLVMALLQKFCPEFIQEGRLYWLRAPICKITKGKKVNFYYNEDEIPKKETSSNIIFYKGLGQLSEEDLRNSMFSDTQQRLEQLTPSESGISALIDLMGEDVAPRKEFVQKIDFGGFNL